MKLVINSNKNYINPISKLLQSVIDCNFKNLKDIILVVSESDFDEDPKMKKISEVSKVNCEEEICVINVKQNNFDYSAYNALYTHKDNDLVRSESYFHVLDTVIFGNLFPESFRKYTKAVKNTDFIATCPIPHSNIVVFGNLVIENYKNNFGIQVTKDEAIRLEHGLEVIKDAIKIRSILDFGNFIKLEKRVFQGKEDIYETGYLRDKIYYPEFDLYKFIMMRFHGDIAGNLIENKPEI